MNGHLLPILKIILAMSIVGSSIVAGKLIVQSFPLFLASELRFLVATMILVPLLIKVEGIPSIHKKDFFFLFLQALFGVFLFNIFMLYGLTKTTAIEGGLITSTVPAFTVVLSCLILKEKLTTNLVIGILLAVLGTMIINGYQFLLSTDSDSSSLLGNLFIFGAVISEALFIIFGKYVAQSVSPLAISTFVSLFGAVLFLPFSLFEGSQFEFKEVSITEWGLILYSGLVVTVIAFILMHQGVSKVPASSTGVLTSFLPLSSTILSVVILGEEIFFLHFIGFGFILIAVFFLSKQEVKKQAE
ncbi:DMT family transporter [Lysinibacillus sp. NPDC097287]|uniref:DMT family transporter n=1 Tax=Lysinibacillus sp. NPDC097287 TaxID=3364144 RepID=UPI00381D842E